MNDLHYSNVMIELEKISNKMDKLEQDIIEFKKLVFPLQEVTITHELTPELIDNFGPYKIGHYRTEYI